MKLVVTGGAGFIGSHIVKYLVNNGHDVVVVDNLYRGNIENLKEIKNEIDFLKIDISDREKMRNVVRNADGVLHQAALTSVQESFNNKEEYQRVNVDGTENIFKLAKEYGFKVVYASSSSVYGNPVTIPILESFERKPINPYGFTKLEDEYLAEKYSKSGAQIIGLRYFNVYGKGQTIDYAGVITKFIENITSHKPPVVYGDGTQVRDFIFVEDVAEANLVAMKSAVDHALINIGTGVATSISELADMLIRLSGLSLKPTYDKPREGDVKASQADTKLAKKLLSWQAKTSLEDGLRKIFPKIEK
ncbi:MAG: SDR family NAD(P)-dependent oxidoreductase [Nitrososphaeraceae archaeon]